MKLGAWLTLSWTTHDPVWPLADRTTRSIIGCRIDLKRCHKRTLLIRKAEKYKHSSSPAIAENRIALSGIAVQHADDGYSRRENFGGSLVRSTVLIHSPDGSNVRCSRRGIWGSV